MTHREASPGVVPALLLVLVVGVTAVGVWVWAPGLVGATSWPWLLVGAAAVVAVLVAFVLALRQLSRWGR